MSEGKQSLEATTLMQLRDQLETEAAIAKEMGELLELAEERHQLWLRERALLQRRLRHQRGELAAQSRVNEELRQMLAALNESGRALLARAEIAETGEKALVSLLAERAP